VRTFFVSFVLSLLACLALTPFARALALRVGAVDVAGSRRKVHVRDIPRLGGAAIVLAFYLPLLALLLVETDVGRQFLADPQLAIGLMAGGAVIAALGVYDDLRGADAKLKLLVQGLTAAGLLSLGFSIDVVNLPLVGTVHLGPFSALVTILWIVGVTNAVNLIDGLDGLAAGIALFGVLPVLVISVAGGRIYLGLVSCCLAGSLLGFLVYNFHPARIFMGDTGSMFLGYVLAVITVQSSVKGAAAVSMLVPLLALGLPIMDTLLTVARRAWIGSPLLKADRGHIHHRLLDLGLSHRRVVVLLYLFSATFAVGAIAVSFASAPHSALVVLLTAVVAAILVRRLGYLSLKEKGLGGSIRAASVVRERNRRHRTGVRQVVHRLRSAGSVSEVLDLAEELAELCHAPWFEVVVPSGWWDGEGDAVERVADGEPAGGRHEFPLSDPAGAEFGAIRFGWEGEPQEETLLLLDVAAAEVSIALWRVLSTSISASPVRALPD